MKRIVVTLNWPLLRNRWRRILITGRAYFILSLGSMLVFVMLGLAGMLQNAVAASPVQSMKGFAASLSGGFFGSLLGMELPHMKTAEEDSPLKTDVVASFLLRFLTSLNPDDPKSLLSAELPGMLPDKSLLLRTGSGGTEEPPEDHGPIGTEVRSGDNDNAQTTPSSEETDPALPPDGQSGQPSDAPEPSPSAADDGPDIASTGGRKVVFIYHSHNRESWFPELKAGTKDANSSKMNITLVGKRLSAQLEKNGIGTVHSNKDYVGTVKDYNWNFSYKYSLQTLQQAVAQNKQLKFFFDIHRDSLRRNKTTTTIGGRDYAQVFFIIGHRNPNWKENEAFATAIHEQLEQDYPGLSRGIWGKTAATGNGEYNQSIAPDSVLIEIGGVDNTLQESYRTADVLAKVIAKLYWDNEKTEKVNSKIPN